jgi:hypothetical protein
MNSCKNYWVGLVMGLILFASLGASAQTATDIDTIAVK